VETILVVLSGWWWIAPAAAGAGAVTYAGFTAKGRRARRLELDAARHEEAAAYRALIHARAMVRTARADHLAERSRTGMLSPESVESWRGVQAAKRAHKSATLELRAIRARVRAAADHYSASSRADPLPVDKLRAAHDAITSRWLPYEVDAAKAISYPGMTDARQPATLAFLRAQREAQRLRPPAGQPVSPQEYIDYRDAVRALEAAFAEAERRHGENVSRTGARRP
jgi:hypothetical protein